jgi:DNA polymerase-3 subunit alpha|tara:strand:- start:677 stop:3301 length:2625 start_codon:yes stop_codon:yes gene_type:complete
VLVKNPKQKEEKKKSSFSSRFKNFELDLHGVRLPKFHIEPKYIKQFGLKEDINTYDFLREICLKRFSKLGLDKSSKKKVYIERIKYELGILQDLDFTEYILLVWKVVTYCRENDIPLGLGRGSAAGSMVLYLLQITEIDPVKYDLFFERFVSKARAKKKVVDGITYLDGSLMCDVDVDVCYYRRQDVLTYLKEEFSGNTSKILTLNTLSGKLVMKECGKVAGGKEESEMNGVTALIPKVFGQVKDITETYEEVPKFKEWCDKNPKVYKIALKIRGLVKNKGVHPSAMLLSHSKLVESCPCELDSSKEPVSSYDMDWSSMFNVKLDVLGLRTASVVDACCKILKKTKNLDIKPGEIDLGDPFIYQHLFDLKYRHGLFQIEADANYEVCRKVKPKNLEELSAVLALARPGAMQFVDQFASYTNNDVYEAIHPFFDDILKSTGGVCLYQEQMMKMAHKIGFTLDEAEILRRIVGKKKVNEVKKWKKKIKDKIKENKLEKEIGDILWQVLEDSANYSFNKSHSISYASLAAITAYLKFKYPQEFFLALLQMTRFEPDPMTEISKIARELPKFNIKLLGPHLMKSEMDFSIEGDDIRFGLTSIKGIAEKSIEKLTSFKDQYSNKFEVFQGANEAGIGVGILSALIQAGALDGTFDKARSYMVAEAQLWNLLTVKEKTYAHQVGNDKRFDLREIVSFLHKELKDEKGRPIIKDSRLETIKKHFLPYREIYNKNRANEDFANWYYENALLGYTHGKKLKEVHSDYAHLESVEAGLEKNQGASVNFIGTVEDSFNPTKSKKGTPYFKIQVKDESSLCTVLMFTLKHKDNIEQCREMNGGTLPSKGNIVIVKGQRKDGDSIFADLIKVQDQKIYMKLSEIKKA